MNSYITIFHRLLHEKKKRCKLYKKCDFIVVDMFVVDYCMIT